MRVPGRSPGSWIMTCFAPSHLAAVASRRSRSPLTVAGPRRNYTGFPILPGCPGHPALFLFPGLLYGPARAMENLSRTVDLAAALPEFLCFLRHADREHLVLIEGEVTLQGAVRRADRSKGHEPRLQSCPTRPVSAPQPSRGRCAAELGEHDVQRIVETGKGTLPGKGKSLLIETRQRNQSDRYGEVGEEHLLGFVGCEMTRRVLTDQAPIKRVGELTATPASTTSEA